VCLLGTVAMVSDDSVDPPVFCL
ncbi:hypothetical protein, partial [Sicyoidochytrium minutum DNA virus]